MNNTAYNKITFNKITGAFPENVKTPISPALALDTPLALPKLKQLDDTPFPAPALPKEGALTLTRSQTSLVIQRFPTTAEEAATWLAARRAANDQAPPLTQGDRRLVAQGPKHVRPITDINNLDFLQAIFRKNVPQGAAVTVCSLQGDPSDQGWTAQVLTRSTQLRETDNNYVSCSTFRKDEHGRVRAKKENVAATHFIMCDDAGVRFSLDRLDALPPSWLIETSPENYQAGYIFESPVSGKDADDLLEMVIDAGLCDEGAKPASTRWARLPVAVNGKPKHAAPDGSPFRCKLREWKPENRYAIQRIIEGLGLQPRQQPKTVVGKIKTGAHARAPARDSDTENNEADLNRVQSALTAIDPNKLQYNQWLHIGFALHASGLEEAEELWFDWCSRYDKNNEEENATKWASFVSGAEIDRDSKVTIATLFSTAREHGWVDEQDELKTALNEINQNYCYVSEQGVATIMREDFDERRNRRIFTRQTTVDFEKDFLPRKFTISDRKNAKPTSLGNIWLNWPLRRQYLGGVVFDPSGKATALSKPGREVLNLWGGFGVEPVKGSCEKFLSHLKTVICRDNDEHYRYLVNWMARAVQHPDSPGEVAVVMTGKKGTGKSITGRAFTSLFGAHQLIISNPRHLTGHHNEHLQLVVALFVEEAPFAGDIKNENALKNLITDDTILVEPKFRKAVESDNYLHIMMASNETHVVRASEDERRYFVLNVSEDRIGDFQYFAELKAELDAGGRSALLYYLLNLDIAEFNVRAVPQTDALLRQKEESWPLEQKWLHEVLFRGYFTSSQYGCQELETWWNQISCNLVAESFEKYARARGKLAYSQSTNRIGHLLLSVGFTRERIKAQNSIVMGEVAVPGEHRGQLRRNSSRTYAYVATSLADVRKGFDALVGFPVHWHEDVDYSDETWGQMVAGAVNMIDQAVNMITSPLSEQDEDAEKKLNELRSVSLALQRVIQDKTS
jgi:hypothetical protein